MITAVKSFKSTSNIPKIEVKETLLTADERIAQLEFQVKELSQRLTGLENK